MYKIAICPHYPDRGRLLDTQWLTEGHIPGSTQGARARVNRRRWPAGRTSAGY